MRGFFDPMWPFCRGCAQVFKNVIILSRNLVFEIFTGTPLLIPPFYQCICKLKWPLFFSCYLIYLLVLDLRYCAITELAASPSCLLSNIISNWLICLLIFDSIVCFDSIVFTQLRKSIKMMNCCYNIFYFKWTPQRRSTIIFQVNVECRSEYFKKTWFQNNQPKMSTFLVGFWGPRLISCQNGPKS